MTAIKHVIGRLPVDTARSGWEAISSRTFPAQALEAKITADWLIVGAGFAGLAAAQRLTELHPLARIVIVDATEIALGPAGRNSGYMIDVPHNVSTAGYAVGEAEDTRNEIALNRYAIDFSRRVAATYGMSRETFDPCGKINAAVTEGGLKHNTEFARGLAQISEPFEILDAPQMHDLTGTAYYQSGLYTPGAVLIEPATYMREFAAGLRPLVEIYENSPVVELSKGLSDWTARTPRGSISAPKVILAINGHIQNFGFYRGRLMHAFTYASMTRPFRRAAGCDRWALLPADPMGATVRKVTHSDGSRIVFRSRFTYNPSMEISETSLARLVKSHRKGFNARFPELAELPFEHTWGGRLCLSMNHAPAFGEVEENLFSACCENGLGTVKSTLAGVLAAEQATGTSSWALDEMLAQPGPSRRPPEPFAMIGATAVIRLRELRAGKEG